MAQLFFKYGTMNSGKSFELLKVAHNYEEQGKKVMIFKPLIDNRGGGKVGSRVGFSRDAYLLDKSSDIYFIVSYSKKPNCILIDESQFLTRKQVLELSHIVDDYDIPVMCFGLKNDFQNNLFEGSEALLIYSDKIEEIKTICWYCDKKATMVLRYENGVPVYDGPQIKIGGESNEDYKPVCRKCYNNGG
jgi:thymidine kinase